jgi:3-hydroxyisobutyrate dehydrogenase-like beta-hydroxyacid dehydrogenase
MSPVTPSMMSDATAPLPALGFVGLGIMGVPMAHRLLAADYPVSVWNRNRHKLASLIGDGATPSETPAELARNSLIVMLCLLDTAAVEQVVFGPDGIADGIQRGAVLIDFSSIRPDATRDFAARLRDERGAGWVDAPVSGGVPGAQNGTLAIMAGGAAADIERVRPVVMTLCQRFTHMGPSGAGQITKLCNQILVGGTMALVAEATQLARSAGIDAAKLPECLRGGTADSPVLRTWLPRMLERQFEDRLAASAIVLKDLDTAHALGRATGTALPMTATAAERFRQLAAKGGGAWDPAALISLYD